MKFYDCNTAPSPRRVRIFMAEKGLEIPTVQVDLRKNEQLSSDFRKLNPWCTVPVLVLDDGTAISEVAAVCRYIEEIHPEPPLLGVDASDRAMVAMWDHRCEIDGFLAASEAFRNAAKGLRERAKTGPKNLPQIPELAERGRSRLGQFFEVLDQRLAESSCIAGDRYSIADITAQVTIDFAGWIKMKVPDRLRHVRRWYGEVSLRPSAKA